MNRLIPQLAAALVALLLFEQRSPAQINRQQAVDALFNPGSGVPITVSNSTVWSPFVDVGFGAGFEGLLPAGAQVDPHEAGWPPFPGPGMAVSNASYFIWIDDEPAAGFQHPTRFVLVDAFQPSPSVANGGIRVTEQGWWPAVTISNGAVTIEVFSTDTDRASAFPPGATNVDGLLAGFALDPADFELLSTTTNVGLPGLPAGLIIRGSPDVHMRNNVTIYENDLREHYQVGTNRIFKANDGEPAMTGHVRAQVANLCNLDPPPSKVFIRLTSHGGIGTFVLADGSISAYDLRELLQPLADKKIPVCVLVSACHSESLLPALAWSFPSNSVFISAASREQLAYGGPFGDSGGGLYVVAFSDALHLDPSSNPGLDANGDGFVDDREAHAWIVLTKPGYVYPGNGVTYYPAGPPLAQVGRNSNPQILVRGGNPLITSRQVYNGTFGDKTDYHIIAVGNVTNGIKTFQSRVALDGLPLPGLGFTNPPLVTYNPTNNRTQIAWEDTNNPVPLDSLILVTVFHPQGALQGEQTYWTPTPSASNRTNATPRGASWFRPDGTNAFVQVTTIPLVSPSPETNIFTLRVGYFPKPFALGELHSANPGLTNLTPGTNFILPADAFKEIKVPVDPGPTNAPLPVALIKLVRSWDVNSNSVTELSELPLPLPPGDTTPLTNCPGSGVFMTVNPPGPGSVFQWYKDGEPIPGATNTTLLLTNLGAASEGIYTGIATNSTAVKRKFFPLAVVDTTPPTINCPSNLVVQCAGPGGTVVNYSISASDSCGQVASIQCFPPPGSLFPAGTTMVSCIALDTYLNAASCIFSVTVTDTAPPLIFCPPDQVFTSSVPVIFNFSPGVGDNCDTNVAVVCVPPSGSAFPPNSTATVTCTATDDSGNSAQCSFKVTVIHPGGPDLRITATNGTVRVTWSDTSAVLQCAPQVTGPWTSMPGTNSPYSTSPLETDQYFRLTFPLP